MRRFSETKYLPHPPLDLFDIIVDVDKYAEFLPWCVASRVRQRNDDGSLIADLSIGYGSLREKFTSSVSSDRDELRVTTSHWPHRNVMGFGWLKHCGGLKWEEADEDRKALIG